MPTRVLRQAMAGQRRLVLTWSALAAAHQAGEAAVPVLIGWTIDRAIAGPAMAGLAQGIALGRKRKRGNKTMVAVTAAVSVALFAVGGLVLCLARQQVKQPLQEALLARTQSPLEKAHQTCAPDSLFAQIGDDGSTLILHFPGEEEAGLDMSKLSCFMTELDVTDAVRSETGATRALDGRRSADWSGFHGAWSYHPDTGLSMTITTR